MGRPWVNDTAKLTPAQAAAIAEIAQTRDGQLRVKLHSKTAALEAASTLTDRFIINYLRGGGLSVSGAIRGG